jgi:hypothetical protein
MGNMSENSMNFKASAGDFIRVFESNLSKKITVKAAYEATERYHEHLTGSRKYSDFESFKTVRSRRRNKK